MNAICWEYLTKVARVHGIERIITNEQVPNFVEGNETINNQVLKILRYSAHVPHVSTIAQIAKHETWRINNVWIACDDHSIQACHEYLFQQKLLHYERF